MGIKEWIIKKLEKDVEATAGHINLEELNEEERNKCFVQFGEGDENLTSFLKTAYDHGAPSIFCCSGHGSRSAYVVLKVTDDNIELLRKVGKVLSKSGVSTNFENNHSRGLTVHYTSMKSVSTSWLDLADRVMNTPELFDDSNPEIYYHEEIFYSYKPFGYDFKKKLLNYLRGTRKELPLGNQVETKNKQSASWKLSEEEKKKITQRETPQANNYTYKEKIDLLTIKYSKQLENYSKETIDNALSLLQRRRDNHGSNNDDIEINDEVKEVFGLMKEYGETIKKIFVDNNIDITHITSVSPQKLEGGIIRKSINRPNNYETERVDAVFASSSPINGNNPYIARNNSGMIRLGESTYIYGGDNIEVISDEAGKKHAMLRKPNFIYYINPENFTPVCNLTISPYTHKPIFEFSEEWISSTEIDISNPNQVKKVEEVKDVTKLLEHYTILCDVNSQGIGVKAIQTKNRQKALEIIKENIEEGSIRNINEETGINVIQISGQDR